MNEVQYFEYKLIENQRAAYCPSAIISFKKLKKGGKKIDKKN